MNNVLVTAIGSFAADIVIKNLKKRGYTVVGCDIYQKEWIVDAYSVDKFYQVPLVSKKEEYLKCILDICKKESISYIMPLTDIEVDLYACNRDAFEKKGVCICISDKETIGLTRNKKKLGEYLNRVCTDIRTIPTDYVQNVDKHTINFPVVCKPDNGRSSQGFRIIYNISEWDNFILNNDVQNFLIQPYIEGSVVTVDVVHQEERNLTVAIGRKELLRTLNGAGTSVYVYQDANLITACKKMAHVLNIKGCVNFEFIWDKTGTYHFLECNPRFSGGVEFSCLAGYDCISNHLWCFQGKEIERFELSKNIYIARKYEEYITYVDDDR